MSQVSRLLNTTVLTASPSPAGGNSGKANSRHLKKYADKLTIEANELKIKIQRERREAKRLSSSRIKIKRNGKVELRKIIIMIIIISCQ